MKFEDYLNFLKDNTSPETLTQYPYSLLFASNSLGGECGELQNMIKKVYRDDEGDPSGRLPDITLELGDILWCWFRLCKILGVSPSDVMSLNVEKMRSRGHLK